MAGRAISCPGCSIALASCSAKAATNSASDLFSSIAQTFSFYNRSSVAPVQTSLENLTGLGLKRNRALARLTP